MMDLATETWRKTTKELIDKLAKERQITPSDVMVLVKFVGLGARNLNATQQDRLKLVS